MKKKNKLLLAALGLVMALVLSGCMHTESTVDFKADGSVFMKTGIYYSQTYFDLIEKSPEEFFSFVAEEPVTKEDLVKLERGQETYYGLIETADADTIEEFIEAVSDPETGWLAETFTEDGKEAIRLTIPMKSDEEALEDQGAEDIDTEGLSQILSAEFNLTFAGGVKSVSGVPKNSYKINKNTVTVNLISEVESQTLVVEGWLGKTAPADEPLAFTDVKPEDYFYEAVHWAFYAKPQVTDGMSDTLFGTGKTCTRGQVVTFLWRAAGCPEPETKENPFTDVKPSDYFYKPVLWAVEKGITDGTTPTTFSPANPCRNDHILTFIWRAVGKPGDTDNPVWYEDAYNWASENKLLSGTFKGSFDLSAPCPRENVVTYLYRYSNQ